MNLVFNKDILGILFDDLENDVNFLLFIKQNNIKVKEGIKWGQLNWASICENNVLTTEFIDEFADYIQWNAVLFHQQVSEDIIFKYGNEMDWSVISEHQFLSEEFMNENEEDLDWNLLCYKQEMSTDFIRKHQQDLDWEALLDSCALGIRKPLDNGMEIPERSRVIDK